MTDTDPSTPFADIRARILAAALPHVAFDGWSPATLAAAARAAEIDPATARAAFPRGAVDLALAFHDAGDRQLADELRQNTLGHLRFTERVAHAVRRRIEIAGAEKDAVRRAMSLYALPMHAADGARALWRTSDTIWSGLGDSSTDYNWYTKRLTLSGVLSATILYWLGDTSEGNAQTWAFLDRRMGDVMRIETTKKQLRDNRLAQMLLAGPKAILSRIRAPGAAIWTGPGPGLPGMPLPEKLDPQ